MVDPSTGRATHFQLGYDYRTWPPTVLDVGPVLDLRDAAANKMGALYSRGEVRDFLDVHSLIASGCFSREELLALGDTREASPLDRNMLVRQFERGLQFQLRPETVAVYGVRDVESVRRTFATWLQELALPMRPLGGSIDMGSADSPALRRDL